MFEAELPIYVRRGYLVTMSIPIRNIPSLVLLFLASLLPGACQALDEPSSPAETSLVKDGPDLIILHTNDMHGQVLPLPATWIKDRDPVPTAGGLERVARYIRQERLAANASGTDILVVDAGDWFQGTPEGGLEKGKPLMNILAHMGFDAVCVGNHEFDHGVDTLLDNLQATELPALLANVAQPNGELLPGTEPYRILERGGARIAIVGVLTTETPSITHPTASTLTWNGEAQTLAYWRDQLQGQYDWLLPLTHIGIEGDLHLAQAMPDLPLIIGGHSHTLLRKGRLEGQTLIAQAGSKARGVGRIEVWIDQATGLPERMQAQVVNLYAETVQDSIAPEVAGLCEHLVTKTDEHVSQVVGHAQTDMRRSKKRWHTSPLGNWVTDVMLEAGKGDIAMQNLGGLRADWKAGPISRRDVFSILPFDNALITLTMNGQELYDLLRVRVEGDKPRCLEFSGAVMEVRPSETTASGWSLVSIEIGGQPLDPFDSYRLVTNDYLARGGDDFEELTFIKERESDGRLQRDVVSEYLLKVGTIHAPTENRYRIGE